MKNNTYHPLLIWSLILMNVILLTILVWPQLLHKPIPPANEAIGKEIERFLEQEVGLSDTETATINKSRQKLFTEMHLLKTAIKSAEQTLILDAIADMSNYENREKQLEVISFSSRKISTLLHQHMTEIRNLCNEEQAKKLKIMIEDIFSRPVTQTPPPRNLQSQPKTRK